MSFAAHLRQKIRQDGAMDIASFMALCIAHYYKSRDPLGRQGDFTTAPEISQMFGEMIGIWCADLWHRAGAPPVLHLVECGPGRGTLMADLLRGTKHVTGFHEALHIHLVEISPPLRALQKHAVVHERVTWHENFETTPETGALIVIGNEFLDALPMRQYQRTAEGWMECCIGLDPQTGALVRGVMPCVMPCVMPVSRAAGIGDVIEISPAREKFVAGVRARLTRQRGGALFIDYGYNGPAVGDTLQAVRNHDYVCVLETAGEADLTSHVDFAPFGGFLTTQGAFLQALGIALRAERLGLQRDMQRLCAPDQMGGLFKVCGFCSDGLRPAGFS